MTLNARNVGLFMAGVMLVVAVVATFTGKMRGMGRTIDRCENPFSYWLTLVIQYGIVAVLIWYSLAFSD